MTMNDGDDTAVGRYYPVSLDLRGKRCLVCGGGRVAVRKVHALRQHGAEVTVVSPTVTANLRDMAIRGDIRWEDRPYREGDLEGYFLVIAATDDEDVNARVSDEARHRGLLVNVVDDPGRSNFIVPAVARRGSLTLAVSTDGRSPALARRIREELERCYGAEYEAFVALLGSLREQAQREVADPARREALFREAVYSPCLEWLKAGREDLAWQEMARLLAQAKGEGPNGTGEERGCYDRGDRGEEGDQDTAGGTGRQPGQ